MINLDHNESNKFHSGIFDADLETANTELREILSDSRCLVIGGAGTIGQAVTKEIFGRGAKALHVIDISENNLVELVRDIRSTMGYATADFKTFAIDVGSVEFEKFAENQEPYDFVFNLSALKHVRSERDIYTLMRLVKVNVFETRRAMRLLQSSSLKKYFCVSTDKAANPVNMMGASKSIMELYLHRESVTAPFSSARFANVAFSDGSLLHGFRHRFEKGQPISSPCDIRRYFISQMESGQLCLMSAVFGDNRDIYFPKLDPASSLVTFSDIAREFLMSRGYTPYECATEDEARLLGPELIRNRQWPCYFFSSDTTGEKPFEEFFTAQESLEMSTYRGIGIIKSNLSFDQSVLDEFESNFNELCNQKSPEKERLVELFQRVLPNFLHNEVGKNLDQRM